MNKKINIIAWVIVVCAVLIAAYIFYSQNKQSYAAPGNTPTPVDQNSTGDNATPKSNSKQNNTAGSSKTMAPDFALNDLNGKSVKLSDYRGKIVILNFWATWCTYCKQEMPDLNDLNKELMKSSDAVILAVDVQESASTVRNYVSSNNISLKVLLDPDGALSQTYSITGFPTTFIINRDGSLYTYIPGATDKATLNQILNKIK